MSYVHVKTEPARSAREQPFEIWQCYHCKSMAVTRWSYEKPPTKCSMCKR